MDICVEEGKALTWRVAQRDSDHARRRYKKLLLDKKPRTLTEMGFSTTFKKRVDAP